MRVSVVENEPRLRGLVEHRAGFRPTDLGLGVLNAFAQAIAQGPSSFAVDMTRRVTAVPVGIVQTPGVSRFFGCTPLGPVGWGIAAGAAASAAGVSLLAPRVVGRLYPDR